MVTVECPNCGGRLQVDDTHDKIFCMYCRAEVTVKKSESKKTNRAQTLIKKGFLALEHREWKKAQRSFNKAAESDPENPQIYVGLLMVETGAVKEEDLAFVYNLHLKVEGFEHAYIDSLAVLANYKKALKFADHDLKTRLERYNEEVIELRKAMKQPLGWQSWPKAIIHALIYPYVFIELMYLALGYGWFFFLRTTLDSNMRFSSDFQWLNRATFIVLGLGALLFIRMGQRGKLKMRVLEEFKKKKSGE